jgi:GT2 family glycosyltransferase
MSEVKVSIVIVNYNVKDLILTCIRSLYQFCGNAGDLEIIVIDNQSIDGSCKAIRTEFPDVILMENSENEGFPKANNQGFSIAKGDYIFMLNPDTEFQENTIEKLRRFLEDNKSVGIVAPGLLNTDGTHQSSVWRYPSLFSIFCEFHYLTSLLKRKNYLDKDFTKQFEAESFSGAAIFFRKSILDEIGNLDETMFWIEDVEFCYRAVQNGIKCVYFPETKIIHHIGQSAKKNYTISISNQVFNKIKFFNKHHSNFSAKLVILLSFLHVVQKSIVFGILSPFNVVYKRKASAYRYTLFKVFNPPKGIA